MKAGRKKRDGKNEKGEWQPSPEQVQCVKLDYQGMSHAEIAKTLTISEKCICEWFHSPNFLEYKEKERMLAFNRFAPQMDKSLINEGLHGSVSAIRTYYEKRGEINGDKEQTASTIIINITKRDDKK